MPNKLDPDDFLYRQVRPKQHGDGRLFADVYDDKWEKQSFMVARVCTPCRLLERFASFPGVRKACHKREGDPDPTCAEMYEAGYRVAATSIEVIRVKLNLEIVPEADGSEYRADGHVNVKGAKLKAALLAEAANSRILTREETLGS